MLAKFSPSVPIKEKLVPQVTVVFLAPEEFVHQQEFSPAPESLTV